jgi:hypothetical protein
MIRLVLVMYELMGGVGERFVVGWYSRQFRNSSELFTVEACIVLRRLLLDPTIASYHLSSVTTAALFPETLNDYQIKHHHYYYHHYIMPLLHHLPSLRSTH